MKTHLFFILFVILQTFSVSASNISVQGKIYSPTQCHYFWEEYGVFNINYQNKQLPWGTRVKLRYGFHDKFRVNSYWQHQDEMELNSTAPYTWGGILEKTVAQRGSFYFNYLEFVFQISLPNGQVYFENGDQSPMGYYGANLSNLNISCQATAQMEVLPVLNLNERDSREQ